MTNSSEPTTESATVASDSQGPLRVFFDGDCPLCRREIAFLNARARPGSLDLVDISGPGCEQALPQGLSREAALRLMHVELPSGEIMRGARAFAAMWSRVPGGERAARLAATPPLRPLLDVAYRVFLVIRPSVQALVRRLLRS